MGFRSTFGKLSKILTEIYHWNIICVTNVLLHSFKSCEHLMQENWWFFYIQKLNPTTHQVQVLGPYAPLGKKRPK